MLSWGEQFCLLIMLGEGVIACLLYCFGKLLYFRLCAVNLLNMSQSISLFLYASFSWIEYLTFFLLSLIYNNLHSSSLFLSLLKRMTSRYSSFSDFSLSLELPYNDVKPYCSLCHCQAFHSSS